MIKDVIINLEQVARDPARDFAISIAETFGTHMQALPSPILRIFRATR